MAETTGTKHERVHLRLDEALTATPLHARLVAVAGTVGVVSLLVLSGCGGGGGGGGGNTVSVRESAAPVNAYATVENERTAGLLSTPPGSLPVKGQPPDRKHGLGPGDTFAMQPGVTEKHGWIEYSCPAGGAVCALNVTADGTIIYERSGGVPVIAEPVPIGGLPRTHGLKWNTAFMVQPGVTEKRGNVEITCPAGGAACALSVTAGLLVKYDPAGGIPSVEYIQPEPVVVEEVHATFIPSGPDEHGTHFRFPPGVKYWLYTDVGRNYAPVMEFDRTLHVGADVAPPDETLREAGSRGGIALSKGEVRDGRGAAEVLDYLKTMASGNIEGIVGLQKWNAAPDIQIVGTETDERYIRLTRDAAQIVNAALPFTQRIKLQSINLPVTESRAAYYYRYRLADFFVRFVPKSSDWWEGAGADELGRTRVLKYVADVELRQRQEVGLGEGALRADVVIDPDAISSFSDRQITYLLVHEFLHAMGFMSHTDPEHFRSTLSETYVRGTEPRSLIHQIDREGLLAAYSRFGAGTLPEMMTPDSLGPWTDTSFHLRGDLGLPSGDVAFGVAFRNGLAQPWAFGPTPATGLAENAALSGTATWEGALIGMTPDGDAVTGDSALTVGLWKVRTPAYLAEPDGTLRFSDIRFEDGVRWGDGDLRYSIEVAGNGFHRALSSFVGYASPDPSVDPHYRASGEDFGSVTGVFFGNAHEGMGGVLERHDLSAAFGGKRAGKN